MTPKFYIRLLLLALNIFVVKFQLTAGGYDYFHHLRTGSEEIRAIYPDGDGRVWIGTIHGLLRYGDFPVEGNLSNYDYYPEKFKEGVYSIQDFDGHRLLIRTLGDGHYAVYNPIVNRIDKDMAELLAGWGIPYPNDWALQIKTDMNHNLWIHSGGILYRHSLETGKTVKAIELNDRIKDISVGRDEMCILTESHIYIHSLKDVKLQATLDNIEDKNVRSQSATIDSKGNIWLSGDNLFRYDRQKSQWSTIRQNIFITDIIPSRSGEILVATHTSGILRFDSDGNELQKIRHIPYDPSSLAADNIRWIMEDADTTLWVCYDKRIISVCNPTSQYASLRHIPSLKGQGLDNDIISIMQDKEGSVWLGSNGHGIFHMNEDGEAFDVPQMLGSLGASAISALFCDSKGRVWIGTYRNGLYCYDHKSVKHYLPQMSVYSILEDKEGRIWLGLLGRGIRYLDKNLMEEPSVLGDHKNEWISNMSFDGMNTIYAASSNGIIAIDTKTLESKHLKGNKSGSAEFRNHNIQSVYMDSRGLLWIIGLDSELPVEIYDQARDAILSVPRLKGNSIKSVVEDSNKNMWLATENAIVHIIVNYDLGTGSYVFIPGFYRFPASTETNDIYYNYRASCRLSDGMLVFGSSDGFLTLNPMDFPPFASEPSTPKLYIASLKVNDSYVKASNQLNGREIINQDLSTLKEIELNHDENNIMIVVGTKDLTKSYVTDLYYRLEGRDSEWRNIRGNTIELTNLSPGNYRLEIGSEQADGNISGDSLKFGIKIKSPWFSRWWAWMLYAILIISMGAVAIYYYLDRQKQKMFMAQIKKESERQYQLNEMKLRFFTNISHDFRTPLSLIITPLETFMSDEANKASVKHLRPVYKNAQRLLTLVNQILDFRKIEINGAALNLSYGDLVSFVKDICSSFTLFAEDTAKQLIFTSAERSVNMYFDKDKVTKIMMNLLSNAFKFTELGSEVKVSLSVEGDYVKISVADNGCGISDEKKQRIFDRFYQAEDQPMDYIGTGIGLHIVKEFVLLHKGKVSVSDNEPKGSVFTVFLPIVKSTPEIPIAPKSESPEEGDTPKDISDSRTAVLVVEDNLDFREYLFEQLKEEYQVYTASNGVEALRELEKNDINIIVTDVMMDVMDGLELCRKVKSDITTSHIPVIMLTAKALPEDEVKGYEWGADEYVTKPFNMSLLKSRIKKLIDDSIQSKRKFKEKLDVNPSEITITSLDERFLSSAIKCVEENMSSPDFSVETMSSMLGVHRTQLYKKLTSLTGKSPVEFIRLIRIKRAAQYLAQSQMFVSEIAYTVGFSSPKLFSKHFKEEFGISPREYQNKYSSSPGPGPEEQET